MIEIYSNTLEWCNQVCFDDLNTYLYFQKPRLNLNICLKLSYTNQKECCFSQLCKAKPPAARA